MANWCTNDFTFTFDSEHENYKKDIEKIDRWDTYAKHQDATHSRGLQIGEDFIFFIQLEDPTETEPGESCICGSYDTKHGPIQEESYSIFLKAFPSLKSVEVNYQEPDNNVFGQHSLNRDDSDEGDYNVYSRTSRPEFLVLRSLRDHADYDVPYASIEEAMEETNCSREEIEHALEVSDLSIGDFNLAMDGFDVTEYYN